MVGIFGCSLLFTSLLFYVEYAAGIVVAFGMTSVGIYSPATSANCGGFEEVEGAIALFLLLPHLPLALPIFNSNNCENTSIETSKYPTFCVVVWYSSFCVFNLIFRGGFSGIFMLPAFVKTSFANGVGGVGGRGIKMHCVLPPPTAIVFNDVKKFRKTEDSQRPCQIRNARRAYLAEKLY